MDGGLRPGQLDGDVSDRDRGAEGVGARAKGSHRSGYSAERKTSPLRTDCPSAVR